jgi:hypothetical protein
VAHVRRSASKSGDTKTPKSNRSLELPNRAVAALTAHRARQAGLRGLPELAGTCREADATLHICAGETLATICADPEVARSAPALR